MKSVLEEAWVLCSLHRTEINWGFLFCEHFVDSSVVFRLYAL